MNKSIIIVEDEPLIAIDLEAELQDRGWTVVGTASTLPQAENLAAASDFQVALLDLNLREHTTVTLAETLLQQNKFVVFLSGSTAASLGDRCGDCPMLSKPVDYDMLAHVLTRAA